MYPAVLVLISPYGMGNKPGLTAANEVSAAISHVLTDCTKTSPKAP